MMRHYIECMAGITSGKLRCLKKNPLTSAFIESVIEDENAWYRRRAIEAYNRMMVDGVPFFTTTFEQYSHIHHYTYLKHKELIDGVIEELKQ